MKRQAFKGAISTAALMGLVPRSQQVFRSHDQSFVFLLDGVQKHDNVDEDLANKLGGISLRKCLLGLLTGYAVWEVDHSVMVCFES